MIHPWTTHEPTVNPPVLCQCCSRVRGPAPCAALGWGPRVPGRPTSTGSTPGRKCGWLGMATGSTFVTVGQPTLEWNGLGWLKHPSCFDHHFNFIMVYLPIPSSSIHEPRMMAFWIVVNKHKLVGSELLRCSTIRSDAVSDVVTPWFRRQWPPKTK